MIAVRSDADRKTRSSIVLLGERHAIKAAQRSKSASLGARSPACRELLRLVVDIRRHYVKSIGDDRPESPDNGAASITVSCLPTYKRCIGVYEIFSVAIANLSVFVLILSLPLFTDRPSVLLFAQRNYADCTEERVKRSFLPYTTFCTVRIAARKKGSIAAGSR